MSEFVRGQTLLVFPNSVPIPMGFAHLKRPSIGEQIPIGARLRPNGPCVMQEPRGKQGFKTPGL